jgi:enoyl-CoA hydratase
MIDITDHDGVWVLTLSRPPVNAIDLSVVTAVFDAVSKAAATDACKAVVITGAPPAFSGGIDVKQVPLYDLATAREMLRGVNRTFRVFYGLGKPTVAAINGHALGAGLVVALGCDRRVAADATYKLGLTEIVAGVPFPGAPMIVVRAELDPPTARRMVLGGVTFGPRDALASAFIDEIVAPGELLDTAIERAATAAKLAGYATVKRQLRADALRLIDDLIDNDSDPMLQGWIAR